ncbi:hypothetical protein AC626_16925 [Pseudoalteromonas rubra]|uniref:Sel1 repeat family protein n=1 Tax=Pseudoalteromonas rubra TaxID=43658 RepID=A0A0L0EPW6_9GAMM|nr:hypothetical protein AC626_16925 [Pseudoalteromonas rubra]
MRCFLFFVLSIMIYSNLVKADDAAPNLLNDALSYYENRGADFSEIKAYEKFSNLAKLGDIKSKVMSFLVFYEFTDSLSEKAHESVNYLIEAARYGDHEAQYFLGFIINHGLFVRHDIEIANKWLKSSADQGNRQASVLLGVNLTTKFLNELSHDSEGALATMDSQVILGYLRHAEDINNADGILALATIIFVKERNFTEAKRLLLKADKLGQDLAKEFLKDFEEQYRLESKVK